MSSEMQSSQEIFRAINCIRIGQDVSAAAYYVTKEVQSKNSTGNRQQFIDTLMNDYGLLHAINEHFIQANIDDKEPSKYICSLLVLIVMNNPKQSNAVLAYDEGSLLLELLSALQFSNHDEDITIPSNIMLVLCHIIMNAKENISSLYAYTILETLLDIEWSAPIITFVLNILNQFKSILESDEQLCNETIQRLNQEQESISVLNTKLSEISYRLMCQLLQKQQQQQHQQQVTSTTYLSHYHDPCPAVYISQ